MEFKFVEILGIGQGYHAHVSCGRGDNSEKTTPFEVIKNSMPQMPDPPSASVTLAAMVWASARSLGESAQGCQLSW